MKNIFVLPTDKPSRLHNKNGELGNYPSTKLYIEDFKGNQYNSFHIYITSNEEISGLENNIWVYNNGRVWLWENTMALRSNNKPKKIILTTDQDLIKDGVQTIDDEFLEWFIKNPSCEKVEVRKIGEEWIYNADVPKEELKTSYQWQLTYPDPVVMDPDGWDRKNYQYSWFEEKITLAEYKSRLRKSTVKGFIPQEKPKQETNVIIVGNGYKGSVAANIATIIGEQTLKPEPNFYEKLKEYFENTPREKVLEDWNKSAHLDKVGPTVDEFIENSQEQRLREAAEKFYSEQSKAYEDAIEPIFDNSRYLVAGFFDGTKWQAERMYTYDELRQIAYNAYCLGQLEEPTENKYNLWIQQFKKK
jgi:hypothetical protein